MASFRLFIFSRLRSLEVDDSFRRSRMNNIRFLHSPACRLLIFCLRAGHFSCLAASPAGFLMVEVQSHIAAALSLLFDSRLSIIKFTRDSRLHSAHERRIRFSLDFAAATPLAWICLLMIRYAPVFWLRYLHSFKMRRRRMTVAGSIKGLQFQ